MIDISVSARIAAGETEVEGLCLRIRTELAALPDSADRFALELLCREALANAIEHGCGQDRSKTVELKLEISGRLARGRVRDEGGGFFGPSEEPGGELHERGKGIIIMRRYSDTLRFEDGGRAVVFERRIDGGRGP